MNQADLIARLKGTEDGPVLGLTGHMDVVLPGEIEWQHDPFVKLVQRVSSKN